jgi:hypothetical protein
MPPAADSATAPPSLAPAPTGAATDLARSARDLAPRLIAWLLPFVLVLYLALEGGGYDAIVRSEVGLAAWWAVLLGSLIGVLPRARIGRAGWAMLGILAAFAVWTGLGIGWSESAERSAGELARVASLLGVFALALGVQGEGSARRTVGAVATAVVVVAGLALLSRMHPSWFPANDAAEFLPSTAPRLNYPLNSWSGLATLAAIGVPLLLWAATAARSVAIRALAAAALPALVLTAYLTLARGGAVELALALAVLLLLHPRRLSLLVPLALGAIGGALLIAATRQRPGFEDALQTPTALNQGDEMLAMTIVVCCGVGLLVAAVALGSRHSTFRRPLPSPRATAIGFVATAACALAIGLAVGLPAKVGDAWTEFKQVGGTEDTPDRFLSASGNSRYQWWEAALDANSTEPLLGIGPGTYEYWWAQEGSLPGFVRDAHSLYLETLAELGIVGLALVVALIGGAIALAARRSLDRSDPRRAALMAAAAAALTAFAAAAAIDWAWELTILPVVFLLLTAAALGPDAAAGPPRSGSGSSPGARAGIALAAAAAIVVILVPMAATTSVRESQQRVGEGASADALVEARRAAEIQPYAATPRLQQALVLELRGELAAAAIAAREATTRERTNWRTWLVLSRIEAERGRPNAALAAYREARSLNPRSPLLAQ